MKSMKRQIIIDTDPGQDDAVAILLALASPEEIELLGIVAVAGNVGLERTARMPARSSSSRAAPTSRSMPAASGRCGARW